MTGRAWCETIKNGVLIKLQIQPKASKTEVVGPHGEPPRLKIRIAAPPVDGAANEEVLRFLKKKLGVPMSNLELIRGHTSKMKDVVWSGGTVEQAIALLSES